MRSMLLSVLSKPEGNTLSANRRCRSKSSKVKGRRGRDVLGEDGVHAFLPKERLPGLLPNHSEGQHSAAVLLIYSKSAIHSPIAMR